MQQNAATIDGEMYLELLGEWPVLIGRFICAFSSCEYWTYVYLQGLGSQAIREEYANCGLDRRVEKIKELAKERAVEKSLMEELTAALGEVKGLGHLRNLAGHNAPMAHVYRHETTGEMKVLMELRAANNLGEAATQENLVKWFTRARKLEDRLALLAGKLAR